jgi:Ni2+-binding GTPase involved in maturation of urease and hydrogenase
MNKNYKKLAVAFSGPSNSGKTTLVVNVSNILNQKGYKVCIVKHDPKEREKIVINSLKQVQMLQLLVLLEQLYLNKKHQLLMR